MKLWEVKPIEKKNVYQRTHFVVDSESSIAAGKTFYMDEWYRWGRCVIKSDEPPVAYEDHYAHPLCLDEYEVTDQESDDGCSLEFVFDEDWTEEERQWVEDMWESEGWFDEGVIYSDDCETEYYGPLEVTEVGEEPDEPPSTENVKSTWPF